MRRKKGFTLIELLVVISIIALLMGILMPALARVREVAYRLICGTNLSGIGKSMLVYANDHNERFPRAGGRRSEWDTDMAIANWTALIETGTNSAFGVSRVGGLPATISSCFYLLVKFSDVTTKQFVCKGDTGSQVFELSEVKNLPVNATLTDFWDFGPGPPTGLTATYVSYAYHSPFYNSEADPAGSFPISAIRNPQSPVAADRNPFLDKNADLCNKLAHLGTNEVAPSVQDDEGSLSLFDPDHLANSFAHQGEGQNVLYADGHVGFESKPTVGIEKDNIWQCWMMEEEDLIPANKVWYDPAGSPCPSRISNGDLAPWGYKDAFLINEYNASLP